MTQPPATPKRPPRAAGSLKPAVIAVVVLVGAPLVPGAFVARSCVRGKELTQQHLEQLRGKPPSPLPEHSPETRAALEQLSRAESVEVDLPSSYSGGDRASNWCSSGTLRVQGRAAPFGVRSQEIDGAAKIVEMSLVRRQCDSRGRRGGGAFLR